MKLTRVTVERRHWRTVRDKKPRLRFQAVLVFDCGVTVRTTRVSERVAMKLVKAGAKLG